MFIPGLEESIPVSFQRGENLLVKTILFLPNLKSNR